jgi:broad specificity phosphatase PhoE
MDEFAERVLGVVIDIGHIHRNQKVLAVSHGWVLDVVERHVAGLPRSAVMAEKPKNGESVWVRGDGSGINRFSQKNLELTNGTSCGCVNERELGRCNQNMCQNLFTQCPGTPPFRLHTQPVP